MRKSLFSLISLSLLFFNCKNETQNPFAISKQHIGLLTDSTKVKDLKTIFANDSVVNYISNNEFTSNNNSIDIYEKGGAKLLRLTPKHPLDSASTISNIHILDTRYKTSKNISLASTFKDIKDNYKITRINSLINALVISIDSINAAFTIDKKELPANLRYDMDLKIEATHIPDNAKIKYFFINWNR